MSATQIVPTRFEAIALWRWRGREKASVEGIIFWIGVLLLFLCPSLAIGHSVTTRVTTAISGLIIAWGCSFALFCAEKTYKEKLAVTYKVEAEIGSTFYSEIGFHPPEKSETVQRRIIQARVDSLLGKKAKIFLEACSSEQRFCESLPALEHDLAMTKERLLEAAKLHADVEKKKRDFWDLHRAAKFFSFATRDTVGDY